MSAGRERASWSTALRRQLGLLSPGRALMPLGVLTAFLLMLQALRMAQVADIAIREAASIEGGFGPLGLPSPPPSVIGLLPGLWVVGAGWALLVWWGEFGDTRRYHWSMPVTHPTHDLGRVLAGAVWLIAAVAVCGLLGAILSVFDGSWYVTSQLGARTWANALAAPLIGYFAASAFPILTRSPLEWIIGTFAFIAIVGAVALDLIFERAGASDNSLLAWTTYQVDLLHETLQGGARTAERRVSAIQFPEYASRARPEMTLMQFASVTAVSVSATFGVVIAAARRRP